MNLKIGLIFSLVINIFLGWLVFYVKGDAHKQAKEFVKPRVEKVNQYVKEYDEIRQNNAIVWELIVDISNAPTKDLSTFTRLAKEKRLPGKSNEAAFLKIEGTAVNGQKARKVGWEKRTAIFVFDAKDNLVSINANDLLEKLDPETVLPTDVIDEE